MAVDLVTAEARSARAALPSLTDERVERALTRAAELVDAETDTILAANARDLGAAAKTLDDGALDRLRLDEQRLAAIAAGVRATATLEPIARDASGRSRTACASPSGGSRSGSSARTSRRDRTSPPTSRHRC